MDLAMKKGTKVSQKGKVAAKKGKKMVSATAEETLETYQTEHFEHESNHPSQLRRGAITLPEIRELADFLIEQAQTLNGIAAKMEKSLIRSLDRVDGVTKGTRGRRLIAEFSANLNRSMIDQRFSG